MKATVTSPSNIAFIKYWGARDLEQIVPENPSLSMTLGACTSRTTVEYLEDGGSHDVRWRSSGGAALETPPPAFSERVVAHLDRLKTWAGVDGRFRMATENTFPAAAGIASSASGFSALTLAVLAALGREASDEMRSRLARRSGSGSASRSVLGGYVRWPAAGLPGDAGNFAQQVAPAAHWDLRDVIALAATQAKGVSSLDGHRRARTSPHFARRLELLPDRYATVEKALLDRDFDTFGAAMEAEAIELHMIAMTSTPAIYYWQPATLEILEAVRNLRRDGVPAYATMDAGANVHVITQAADEPAVAARLSELGGVEGIIRDGVGDGPRQLDEHLF